MQTEVFSVSSGVGVTLWRGIPAEITVAGIEDVSGDWLFLVDNDNSDGAILSGTVAAADGALVVTISNMDTVELAAAIQGRQFLQCRATLTDGTSCVYLIPLTIRNRAVSGTPTPVAEYYTKAQVDALIAAIPAGTSDYTELDNKPTINGFTLNGDLSASDLGLITADNLSDALSGFVPKTGGTFTGAVSALSSSAIGVWLYTGGHAAIGQSVSTNYHVGSLVVGFYCSSQNNRSSAFGRYNSTSREDQIVLGEFSAQDADAYLVVGNGTSTSARSNAFVVKKTGDAVMAGDLTFTPSGGTATTLSALIARIVALEAR